MNKQQVETIIDKLAGRCHCYDSCSPKFKHPVLIGDVLEKIYAETELEDNDYTASRVMELWQPCGFSKSLQLISEDLDFKENPSRMVRARNLFEFLDDTFQ